MKTASMSDETLETAADWFVHLNSGNADPQDWQEFRHWLDRDAAHQQAWQRIEKLQNRFDQVPTSLSKASLDRGNAGSRSWAGKLLSVILIAGVITGLTFSDQYFSTDYYTAKGDMETIELADGTELTLNTDTNVAIDYGLFHRTIDLRTGEILIETAPDSTPFKRDFHVDTAHGRITALGTRFRVRLLRDSARVSVFEGRVAIAAGHNDSQRRILDSGQSTTFDGRHVADPDPVSRDVVAWTRGMFIADDMPLCRFIAELERYHEQAFFCSSRLTDLRISGAFPLTDRGRVLNAISLSLPVEIHEQTNGDIVLRPRS